MNQLLHTGTVTQENKNTFFSLIHHFNILTQELVNLILTGATVSNVLDGAISLDTAGDNNVRVFTVGPIFSIVSRELCFVEYLEGDLQYFVN